MFYGLQNQNIILKRRMFLIACFQVHKYTKFGKGINNIRNSLHSRQRAAFYNVFVHDCTNKLVN